MRWVITILAIAALAGAAWFVWGRAETQTVKLYYYSEQNDLDAEGNLQCSRQGLVPVERELRSAEPVEDTLKLLLKGELTPEERGRGISTEFPLPGLELEDVELRSDGTLTLTFDDPENKTGGGACRVGILWFQIEATALQFREVSRVEFRPKELFQP